MKHNALHCSILVVGALGFVGTAGGESRTRTGCPVDTFQYQKDGQMVEMSCEQVCPPWKSSDQALTFCYRNCRRYFDCLLKTLPNPDNISVSETPSGGVDADDVGTSCASTIGLFYHITRGFQTCKRVCTSLTLFCQRNCPGYACHRMSSAAPQRVSPDRPQTGSGVHRQPTTTTPGKVMAVDRTDENGDFNVSVLVLSQNSTAISSVRPTVAAVLINSTSTGQSSLSPVLIAVPVLSFIILTVIGFFVCKKGISVGGKVILRSWAERKRIDRAGFTTRGNRLDHPTDVNVAVPLVRHSETQGRSASNGDRESSLCTARNQPARSCPPVQDEDTEAKVFSDQPTSNSAANSHSSTDCPCDLRSDNSAVQNASR